MCDENAAVRRSLEALDRTVVRLEGVRPAAEVIPSVGPRRYLHAGPPISVDELPGPTRGAVLGALVFEREADDIEAATRLLDSGEVELAPGHDVGAVGAMAGVISPRMPVVVAGSDDRRAFSPLNEGLGRALRFGSYDRSTLARLAWMADVGGPLLDRAIASAAPIELTAMIAEGLRRGDECHNRNVASTAALVATLAPSIAAVARSSEQAAEVLAYAGENRHFFLSFSIAAAKVLADSAHGIPASPIVTAIAGNGRRVGIRVSGTADAWFTAPATLGDVRFFDGYDAAHATPTLGDSFITETAGFGAFALAAAPAITSFIGGTVESCRALVAEMHSICAGRSERLLVPFESFAGTPLGIDVRRVAETGLAPVLNNGIAHRDAGVGQVGAGINRLPAEPFVEAARSLTAGSGG